jgi:hypothetical protein
MLQDRSASSAFSQPGRQGRELKNPILIPVLNSYSNFNCPSFGETFAHNTNVEKAGFSTKDAYT